MVGSVLNGGRGNSRVAEATADKIIAIAKELNYRASPTAQQLRGKRSRVFGLLVASAAIRDSTKGPAKVGSVLYFLLPQLEQQALYQSISGWTMNPFFKNQLIPPPAVYICPSELTADPGSIIRPDWHASGWGGGNYVSNVQALNHWWANKGICTQPNPFTHPETRHITDGSNTVVFAERYAICTTPPVGEFGRTHWLGTPATKWVGLCVE